MTYTLELTPEQVESLKQQGIIDSGEWKPKADEDYWFLDSYGSFFIDGWMNNVYHESRLAIGNCLPTLEAAELHKLRLQSMAQRGKMPDEGDKIWYWSFYVNRPEKRDFWQAVIPDWAIGSVKKTEKECADWGAKYAESWKV